MNTAQQHALEQANLITQLIKYADRIILVESASEPERRAFVKLLDDQLPDHIDIIGLRASAATTPAAIISLVSNAMQLSPGIQSPQELATAIHEALSTAERVLVVIENADNWKGKPQWAEMVRYLRAAHDIAPNQLLFLLTGGIGLTDQLRLESELAEMQSDMHPCQLLGETTPSTEPTPVKASGATTAQALFIDDPEDGSNFNASEHVKPTKRFSPVLLIAAGISVAIVAFGGFALLTRSTDQPANTQTLPLKTEPTATSTAPSQASNEPVQTHTPLPHDDSDTQPDLQGSEASTAPAPATLPAVTTSASMPNTPTPSATEPLSTPSQPTENTKPAAQSTAVVMHEAPLLIPPKPEKPVEKRLEKPVDKSVDKPVEQPTATKPAEKAAPTPIKKTQTVVAKPSNPKPSVKHVSVKGVDNAWYGARALQRAAIQFGAFKDEKSALGFIKKQAPGSHVAEWHLFSQTKNNQVLYTVTAGDFSTVSAARKALSQLPAELQKLKPYPRSFASIRKAMAP